MYLLGVIVVCACCLAPGAQYLQMQGGTMETVGSGLSCCSMLVTIGVFVYVGFFTTIISQYWKEGFSSVGAWCAGLCIMTIAVAIVLCVQLCYFGAVYSGLIPRNEEAEKAFAHVNKVGGHSHGES